MSEISGLWTTGGATGDQQASYTQADDANIKKILAACSAFEGVAPGFLNELECTPNGANTVAVDTGGAVVDGKYYLNDASDDINIPSASGGGNTRIDRIVLRADWAGFAVSIHRIAGTDAATPSAPAITQTSETTYDIKLCQVLVTTGGVVTVTDEREWAAQVRFPANDNAVVYVGRYNSATGIVRFPSGWTISNISSGYDEITHNLGSADYSVVVSAISSNAVVFTYAINTNTFGVLSKAISDGSPLSASWSFILIRY